MRLPFPERIPLFPVLVFCAVLGSLQQLQGTSVLFTVCTFFFIVIATVAFNVTGGLARPSGGYILAYTLLTATVGITYKVVVGEAGQSNLTQPERTIEVYVGTISAMLVAAYLGRRFSLKKSYLPKYRSNADMRRASIGCLAVGVAATLFNIFHTSGSESGTVGAVFGQMTGFLTVAMILAVLSEIRRSDGKRSFNTVSVIAGLLLFAGGVLSFSKQGFFTPLVCWLLPAASQRYKVSIVQIAGFVMLLAFISYYLTPYSQYGRSYRIEGGTFSENFKVNVFFLTHLEETRKTYNEKSDELYSDGSYIRYYNKPQGLMDRLQMLAPDDLIINYTENGGVFGIEPTIFTYVNLIPHVIWHDKPIINFGNTYAHELGIINDDADTSTGISFSPSGDAFHQAKWIGVLVMLPILLFILFFATDSVCGDTRASPFALMAMINFLHSAPEGGVVEVAHGGTGTLAGIWFLAFICAYLMPLVADLVIGPAKQSFASGVGASSKRGLSTSVPPIEGTVLTDASSPMYRWSKGRQGA